MVQFSFVKNTEQTSIRTFTGRMFCPLAPDPADVDIEDIAHALSLICRFTGHTYCFYSVADHSLRVSMLAEQTVLKTSRNIAFAREIALWGLLHDASEAYLCDVPTPLKRTADLGRIYKMYERHLTEVIAEKFDLLPHEPAVVKEADRVLLSTEMRDLMNNSSFGTERLPETIFPLEPRFAEVEFLRRFEALTTARKAEHIADALSPRKAS